MAQQTAVEWLFDQIPLEWTIKGTALEIFKKAKEMEKEQIIDAFHENYSQILWTSPYPEKDAEDYYNENYGNDSQGKI